MKDCRYKLFLLGLMISLLLLSACGTAGLNKPSGKGPFPAVIVLHSSTGIHQHTLEFASDLSSEGYVTLVVYYLSAQYGGYSRRGAGRIPDVIEEELRLIVEAYDQLKAQPYVDPKRIGMVGFSLGANRALIFAVRHPERKIRGIVNYYAGCMGCGSTFPRAEFPPILFLHGDGDLVHGPVIVLFRS